MHQGTLLEQISAIMMLDIKKKRRLCQLGRIRREEMYMFDSTYLAGRDMHIRLSERHAELDHKGLQQMVKGDDGFSIRSFVNSATTRVSQFAGTVSDGVQSLVAGPQEPGEQCC
jgi:hypothetical protein